MGLTANKKTEGYHLVVFLGNACFVQYNFVQYNAVHVPHVARWGYLEGLWLYPVEQ